MTAKVPVSPHKAGIALCLALMILGEAASAAGIYLRPANDSNSRLEIKDAIANGKETTVLFWTWPDRGDPDYKTPCSVNFYTVTVSPGLASPAPEIAAKAVCTGMMLAHAGLLEGGRVKLISRDRLEEWRDGEQVSKEMFSSMKEVGSLRIEASEMGSQFFDWSPSGDMVMAILVSGHAAADWPNVSGVVASLKPDNEKRWLMKLTNEHTTIDRLWAGEDGGALLSISTYDPKSMVPDPQTQLLMISSDGKASYIPLMNVAEPFDYQSIRQGSEEDLQKFYAHQQNNRSESIKTLLARARNGGGFDVLYWRESQEKQREGHFLRQVNSDGSIQSELGLGNLLHDHGLDQYFDFYVSGNRLALLSRHALTQKGVNSRRKTWPQSIVSSIDLASKQVAALLIPLERQYLEAAMNAGDEGQQHLEARPGSIPALLTSVDGVSMAVGQRFTKRGTQLHLQEATDDLVTFTEAYDKHLSTIVKAQQSEKKKADRRAMEAQVAADMQSITGMSESDFERLDDKEQMRILMQEGNMESIMAAAMKQAQSAQSNMTPEQQRQMQAQMVQMQQMMQGGGIQMPSGNVPDTPSVPTEKASQGRNILTVDSLQRGHVQYTSNGNQAVTLQVINRNNGDELVSSDFPDGVIDEYVNLGRYKLPLEVIGVIIRDSRGEVLADLSPGSN